VCTPGNDQLDASAMSGGALGEIDAFVVRFLEVQL
jgi:hypothetical protein